MEGVLAAFAQFDNDVRSDRTRAGMRAALELGRDLVYCGDNKRAKKTAATLIGDVGFNPVDLGALSTARYVEPFSLLVAQIAYSSSNSPELSYRFERFSKQAE